MTFATAVLPVGSLEWRRRSVATAGNLLDGAEPDRVAASLSPPVRSLGALRDRLVRVVHGGLLSGLGSGHAGFFSWSQARRARAAVRSRVAYSEARHAVITPAVPRWR